MIDASLAPRRVWLATLPVDFRKGFDGLAECVRTFLGCEPHGGDLFVFRNKSGGRVKILWHDGTGVTLYYKRLDRGGFRFPAAHATSIAITPDELLQLLSGAELARREFY